MARQRMIGRQRDQGAGDGIGGERIVRRRFDQHVRLGQSGPGDSQRRHHRDIARGDVQLAGADRPDRNIGIVALTRHPAIEKARADGLFDQRGEALALEHRRKRIVHSAQDRFRQTPGGKRKFEALLEQGVVVEHQPLAQRAQQFDDFGHRDGMEVGQPGGIAQDQVVDMAMRIGLTEIRPAPPLEGHCPFSGQDDPAAGHDRNVEHLHHSTPCTNSMNSL